MSGSESVACAAALHDFATKADVVDRLETHGRRHHRHQSSHEFLARAAGAQEALGPSYASNSAAPAAASMAAPTPAPTRSKKPKRPTGRGLEVAGQAFWATDADASAALDRDEWTKLMESEARTMSVTIDEAFLRADADGDGTITLQEFLASKEASQIADRAIASTLAPSADEQRVSDAVKRVYDVWGASSPVARRPDSDPTVPPPAVAAVVQSFGALAVGGAADGSDASLAWAPHDEAPEAMERRRHRPRTSQGHSQQHSKHRHARRRSASEEAPPAPALAPLAPLSHQQHRQHPHRRHRRTESGGEEARADTAGSGSTALTRQRSSRRHRERRRGRGERHRSSTPDPL